MVHFSGLFWEFQRIWHCFIPGLIRNGRISFKTLAPQIPPKKPKPLASKFLRFFKLGFAKWNSMWLLDSLDAQVAATTSDKLLSYQFNSVYCRKIRTSKQSSELEKTRLSLYSFQAIPPPLKKDRHPGWSNSLKQLPKVFGKYCKIWNGKDIYTESDILTYWHVTYYIIKKQKLHFRVPLFLIKQQVILRN